MAHLIPLHLILELGQGSEFFDSVADSDQDVTHPYPGTPEDYDLTNNPPQLVQPVWIGVSEDGTQAQAFPVTMSVADIIAAGWPRVYQGTEIADASGDVTVYTESYASVLAAMAACCGAGMIATAAYALKQSNAALTPGQSYPCTTEALYKWLAILGTGETRNLEYQFQINISTADNSISLSQQIEQNPLSETVQHVVNWPDDILGFVWGGGEVLVANDVVPGPGEYNVGIFDGGTITATVSINDIDLSEQVMAASETFAIPNTICEGIFSEGFSPEFI